MGLCGIPPTAKAVSANLTVTAPSDAGNVRAYPGDAEMPLVSTLNYTAGQTRANNALLLLGTGGAVSLYASQASGTVHVIVDVNGHFE